MTTWPLGEVFARTSTVLLDFDGPVCSVFSDFEPVAVAAELQSRLDVVDAPPDAGMFDTLRYIAANRPGEIVKAEAILTDLELRAVQTAEPTPYADAVIRRLHELGRPVIIVSNNSSACVNAYLNHHGLTRFVSGVASRKKPDPALLKPHPHLLREAMQLTESRNVESCVMVGDSVSDVEAARAAGTAAVAYANKPGKRERFGQLHPDAIIDSMSELLDAA
ncbi:HAD family hydrolase [Amycolatopsis regifaucium]|uniref:Haloacid dehalogenase n=1 Tax=Amycolatopsis regifaucium TaxID=546365 RepID=A0A154MKP0_9PSEU|nr:HAD-IA family hydrolase [Amycolatopsis regifaucium]KZB84875.1 hypothetical protein AVL48_01300 [Amycolatopsis regifaucium]OKA03892.1 hypothetical protein ATP06_0232150 [Amycolatopsis regifaucium]